MKTKTTSVLELFKFKNNLHLILLLFFFQAYAQTPGDLDIEFVPQGKFETGTGLSYLGVENNYNLIRDIAIQPNGKVLASGYFNTYNGIPVSRLIRINDDGSLDTSFNNTGIMGAIHAITLQPDDKILIGGEDLKVDGVDVQNIVRLNSDGTLDPSFSMQGSGLSNIVRAIKVLPNGKILVGGNFNYLESTLVPCLLRLFPDGTRDTNFNTTPASYSGPGPSGFHDVYDIYLLPTGKILIGGKFVTYNDIQVGGIARITENGALDPTFNEGGSGFNSTAIVSSLDVQSDGKILATGNLHSYNGIVQNVSLYRLNVDGTLDDSFNADGEIYHSGTTRKVKVLQDGRILVGTMGQYNYNGSNYSSIICLNSDGYPDDSYFSTLGGFDERVIDIVERQDGNVVIAGAFSTYNNQPNYGIIELYNDGDNQKGFNDELNTVLIQPDGKILGGGKFTQYSSNNRFHFIRLNENGNLDNDFADAIFDGNVNTIQLQSDNKIIIAGEFNFLNNEARNRIIRLLPNGNRDTAFNPGSGANSDINTSVLQSDGKIIVAGDFTTFNGQTRNRIVRLNSNGSVDNSFNIGDGFNNTVNSMALQSDGKLIAFGEFTTYMGHNVHDLVRLNTNGSLDTSFNLGTGFNGKIHAIEIQEDGKILVGGDFTSFNNQSYFRILRLNPDGSVDTSFQAGAGFDDTVLAIKAKAGKIYIGGEFQTFNAQSYPYFIVLNSIGEIETDYFFGTGFDDSVTNIKVQADGQILIAGKFNSYDGLMAKKFARIWSENGSMGVSNIQNQKASISVYPNPVRDILNIQSDENLKKVEIYDMTGKLIQSHKVSAKSIQLNVEQLNKGVYIIKMITESSSVSKKIVK